MGTALSLPLVMSLTNLTCYYYSMFIVAAALASVRPMLGAPILMASGIGKLLQYAPWGFYWVDDRWWPRAGCTSRCACCSSTAIRARSAWRDSRRGGTASPNRARRRPNCPRSRLPAE